jgi:hypothetical protein
VPVTAVFPKTRGPSRVATFLWPDETVATTPIWGRPERLPHDLDHYIIEAVFRPPYGFWGLVERQAPFSSLTLVAGRWPKDKAEWFQRVVRKHGTEMLKAEATGLELLFQAATDDDVDRAIPELRRRIRRSYALSPENAFGDATRQQFYEARQLHTILDRAWRGVPMGGALEVLYPRAGKPTIHPRVESTIAVIAPTR